MKVYTLVAALMVCSGCWGQTKDICNSCKCIDYQINCTLSDLDTQPSLGDLANKTTILSLDHNLIRVVRVFEPSYSLTNLSFSHNLLIKIDPKAFESLYNITYLDLSHNSLTSEYLKPITFKGPDTATSVGTLNLKVLHLNSNSLHTLHHDLFEYLSDLEELYLASNPFKILDHGTLVALSSIHKVRILDLSSTQLSAIPPQWLNAAKNLEKLDLSINNLTTVPSSLEEVRGLRHLILSNNPITTISYFPNLPTLHILEINWMQRLTTIKAHSLVNASNLKELYISNNCYLYQISEDALIEPGSYNMSNEGAVFPPIETLVLSDNKLEYFEEGLINRWDNLKVLKLEGNPWICDCKNQWMLSTLIPLMNDKGFGSPESLICGAPVEMKNTLMIDLARKHYQMRCLDLYGNEPDKDAKVLIVVLVAVLISIPVSLLFLHLVKRPRGVNGYPTAYYRKAHSFESIN